MDYKGRRWRSERGDEFEAYGEPIEINGNQWIPGVKNNHIELLELRDLEIDRGWKEVTLEKSYQLIIKVIQERTQDLPIGAAKVYEIKRETDHRISIKEIGHRLIFPRGIKKDC